MHPALRILDPPTPNIYPKLPPKVEFPARLTKRNAGTYVYLEVYRTALIKGDVALCAVARWDSQLNNYDVFLFSGDNRTLLSEYNIKEKQDAIAWCDRIINEAKKK